MTSGEIMNLSDLNLSQDQIERFVALGIQYATQYGLLVVYALLIFIIGRWIAGRAAKATRAGVLRTQGMDEAVAGFLSSIVRWLVLAVVAIAILQLFGIDSTSLVAILGAATLAIGLALQSTLSNFAAGVMLLIFRPFRLGHYIDVASHSGTVKSIDIFTTELATVDNVQIIIPNSQVWSNAIVNYSGYDRRRVDLTIGIDYGANIDKALATVREIVAVDERCCNEPEPFVKVTNLGDSSVDVTLRVWCQASDYWDLKFDLTKRIKEAFDAFDIAIPYPHMEIVQKQAG